MRPHTARAARWAAALSADDACTRRPDRDRTDVYYRIIRRWSTGSRRRNIVSAVGGRQHAACSRPLPYATRGGVAGSASRVQGQWRQAAMRVLSGGCEGRPRHERRHSRSHRCGAGGRGACGRGTGGCGTSSRRRPVGGVHTRLGLLGLRTVGTALRTGRRIPRPRHTHGARMCSGTERAVPVGLGRQRRPRALVLLMMLTRLPLKRVPCRRILPAAWAATPGLGLGLALGGNLGGGCGVRRSSWQPLRRANLHTQRWRHSRCAGPCSRGATSAVGHRGQELGVLLAPPAGEARRAGEETGRARSARPRVHSCFRPVASQAHLLVDRKAVGKERPAAMTALAERLRRFLCESRCQVRHRRRLQRRDRHRTLIVSVLLEHARQPGKHGCIQLVRPAAAALDVDGQRRGTKLLRAEGAAGQVRPPRHASMMLRAEARLRQCRLLLFAVEMEQLSSLRLQAGLHPNR